MLAQSTSQQPAPSIVGSSYAVQGNTLGYALYSNREFNDLLLRDIFAIAVKNGQLAGKIEELRLACPAFLNHWWESTQGIESMTAFLKDVERTYEKEIDEMEENIGELKRMGKSNGEDLEYELDELSVLLNKRAELQKELDNLTQRNNEQQQQLNYLYAERRNFRSTYKELRNVKELLSLSIANNMANLNKFLGGKQNRDYEEAAERYQQQEKAFLLFLFERRNRIEKANTQMQGELDKINTLIEKFQAQSKGIQLRKESIVSKHVELKKLREELAVREQQRREAAKKKRNLQKLYCEQQMQNLTQDYHQLQTKCDQLVGRALQLAKQSIDKTKLRPLQKIILRELPEQ